MARPFFRRRKTCPFSAKDAPVIDYKDVRLLQGYLSERGKIVPSRITAPDQGFAVTSILLSSDRILASLLWANFCSASA